MDSPETTLTPVRWAELPAEEAAQIRSEIATRPWEQELFAVFRRSDGALVLHLGSQTGPYAGGGDVVVAVRGNAGWSLERTDFWTL